MSRVAPVPIALQCSSTSAWEEGSIYQRNATHAVSPVYPDRIQNSMSQKELCDDNESHPRAESKMSMAEDGNVLNVVECKENDLHIDVVDYKHGNIGSPMTFNKDGKKIRAVTPPAYTTKPLDIPHERAVLERFFNETNGNEWKTNTNWCTDRHVCDWHGVVCDKQSSHVVKIHLSMNGLRGDLPHYFSELTELTSISLSHNHMSGTLPVEWAMLPKLEYVSLVKNQIEGKLPPEWGCLDKVFLMDLASNRIVGRLPPEWHNMKKLRQLRLCHNRLVGELPDKWKDLSELTFVQLQGNTLDGDDWATSFTPNCTVVIDEDNRNVGREIFMCLLTGCCQCIIPKAKKKPYYSRD
jgi:hypothetical protein